MKRLTTLLLAAGLICSAFSAANAADIKAKGMWDFSFEYTNDSFDKHNSSDRFGAAQRLRTQIDVIASESLKGVVYFEIGDTHWGHAKDGASLGTDGRTVEVRYSYIDWAIPETDVLVRMGLQPFVMPGFVAGSAVLDGDGAASPSAATSPKTSARTSSGCALKTTTPMVMASGMTIRTTPWISLA